MKPEEKIAEQYLRAQGFADIAYEPNGNIPPDFVVNGETAVEVRRLNQQKIGSSGVAVGIETDQFTALSVMKEVLSSRRASVADQKWWVSYRFSGVLPPARQLKEGLKRVFDLLEQHGLNNREINVFENFAICLTPRSNQGGPVFQLTGYSDRNAGGWSAFELQRNLQFCSLEKAEKIKDYRARYKCWWFLLVDYVGYGQSESICIDHDWDRVIMIDPRNHLRAYTL